MSDNNTTVAQLREMIRNFSRNRNWLEKQNPKDLTMALSVEASEILEIFQWIDSKDAFKVQDDEKVYEHIKEEVADVFWYLMRLCDSLDIDLSDAVFDKEKKNASKYPPIENNEIKI